MEDERKLTESPDIRHDLVLVIVAIVAFLSYLLSTRTRLETQGSRHHMVLTN